MCRDCFDLFVCFFFCLDKIAGKSAHIAQMTKSQNVSKADRIRKQKLALGLKPKPITMVRSQPKRSVPKPIVNGRRMRGSTPNNKLLLPVQRLNTANKIEIMQPAISNQSSSVGCSKHDGVILAEKENFSINSSDDQRLEDDPKKETETVAPKTNLKTSTTNGEDKPKKLNLLARLAPKKPFVKAQTESMDKASIPVVSLPPPEKSTTAQVSEKPKKPDLHSRFVQKQPFVIAETKESVKIILTQMAAPEKPHSAQITVKPQSNNQHHESPKALSTGERSRRSQDLHVRFAPNCIEQSEDGTKSKPLESYEKPPLVSYTPSRSSSHENLPKINLSDRLAKPKTENTDQLSESPRPTPPKKNIRAALLKICQESQQQSILPKNTEKEEKLNLNARLQQTQDCTKIESAPDTNAEIVPIKGNLSSRFSSKQLIDSSEVQTITKKVRKKKTIFFITDPTLCSPNSFRKICLLEISDERRWIGGR